MSQPRTNGHTVRAIRRARGIRQDHLAMEAPVSAGYLCHVEAGRRFPLPEVTRQLAAALDVDPKVLTGEIPPIETLRTIEGLSVHDLAQRCGLTIARLQRIEQGTDIPDPDLAAVLAARLGCPVEAITPQLGRPGGRVA
jgi:transcriptional regulator with XRE-family HTH domain